MSSLTLRAVVSLLLLSLGRRAVAQESLAFVFPPPLSAHTPILFTTGRNVNFQWTSTWPTVSLQIWQGPDSEGHNPHLDLLKNVTNSTTSYMWSAHNLHNLTRDTPLHLYLYNSNDPDCQGCHANTSDFFVQLPPSSSASISSAAATATPSGSGTANGSGNGNGTDNAVGNKNSSLKLGLGLGLGLGIPLLIVLVGLAVWLTAKKRRAQGGPGDEVREQQQQQQAPPHSAHAEMEQPVVWGGSLDHKPRPAEVDGTNRHELPADRKFAEAPQGREPMELEGDSVRRVEEGKEGTDGSSPAT